MTSRAFVGASFTLLCVVGACDNTDHASGDPSETGIYGSDFWDPDCLSTPLTPTPKWVPVAVSHDIATSGIGYVRSDDIDPTCAGYQREVDGPYPVFEREGGGDVIGWYFHAAQAVVPVGAQPTGPTFPEGTSGP